MDKIELMSKMKAIFAQVEKARSDYLEILQSREVSKDWDGLQEVALYIRAQSGLNSAFKSVRRLQEFIEEGQ